MADRLGQRLREHLTRSCSMNTGAASIAEFCSAHHISKSHLYNILKRGRGPTIMKVGKRTLISNEAAAAWRRAMEGLAIEDPTHNEPR